MLPLRAPAAALLIALGLAPAAALAAPDPLAAGRLAMGVGAGSNGGSVEAAYALNRYLDVRAQGAFIGFDADFKSSGVRYDGHLEQYTGGAMADLHPFANPLFVAGGFVSGARTLHVKASPTEAVSVRINGVSFPVDQVVHLTGDADLGATAPFAGLGFDNTFTHAGHWGVRAVAGLIFGQDPKVTLHASGPYADNAAVLAAVAQEQASLQSDVDGYRYYPVVQLGVTYRF